MDHKKEGNISNEQMAKVDMKVQSPNDDFTVVEGEKLYVPKLVLRLASPVFEMLNTDFRENNQDEVELPDKSYDNILKFLECIHPGFLTPIRSYYDGQRVCRFTPRPRVSCTTSEGTMRKGVVYKCKRKCIG